MSNDQTFFAQQTKSVHEHLKTVAEKHSRGLYELNTELFDAVFQAVGFLDGMAQYFDPSHEVMKPSEAIDNASSTATSGTSLPGEQG